MARTVFLFLLYFYLSRHLYLNNIDALLSAANVGATHPNGSVEGKASSMSSVHDGVDPGDAYQAPDVLGHSYQAPIDS